MSANRQFVIDLRGFVVVLAGVVGVAALLPSERIRADEPPKKSQPKVPVEAQKVPVPENPITNLIKNLFPAAGAKPKTPIIPQNPVKPAVKPAVKPTVKPGIIPANGDLSARDYIDARAPYDPNQSRRLRQTERLLKEGKWEQALEILQRILESTEDSLVRQSGGKLVSVRIAANRLLAKLPAEGFESYRLQYNAEAKRNFEEAVKTGNTEACVSVATRHFHTDAGMQAANYLGTLHFDHGEFGMAARWFRMLLETEAPFTKKPRWRLRTLMALRRSGDVPLSDKLLGEFKSGSIAKPLTIGGEPIDPARWIAKIDSSRIARTTTLEEWYLFRGNANRTGTASGGLPLLLPRWHQPLSGSRSVLDQISQLLEDLSDQRFAAIPAMHPLMIDGKLIYRTLRGVQVVEAQTGKLLWETVEGVSAERLLTGVPYRETVFRDQDNLRFSSPAAKYNGFQADRHQLTSLLLRNGTYGIISSDGKQLYVLEDQAVLAPYQPGSRISFNRGMNDVHRRRWESNKITAYNLATGRPEWHIGGMQMDEPFDLPLAGTYFVGTPLPFNGELYVVGEKGNEIRLYSLNPENGSPKWSQLIAYSDAKIERDFGRRWFTSQIAANNGVLICPTTVGWLVAVDRLNQTVLWAHRYSKPAPSSSRTNRQNSSVVPSTSLNTRWSPSSPTIVGNRVVFTPSEYRPSEKPIIICLDLFTGKKIWQKDKNNFLYSAGIFDDRVLLVGKDSVAAISLEDGHNLWTTSLPASAGKPSGTGVAVGDLYHLPLETGQLWSLNLADGTVAKKSFLRNPNQRIGNLAMYRGMLLSLSPLGVTAFEQREAIEQQIRQRLAANPKDVSALLRSAEIELLDHDFARALSALRQIRQTEIPHELQSRFRSAMVESLVAVVRTDFSKNDREMRELGEFVRQEKEQRLFRRLAADRAADRKEYETAFSRYLEILEESSDEFVSRGDNSNVTLRRDNWIAGNLLDLWNAMPAAVQSKIFANINARAKKTIAAGSAEMERFVTLFAFHPSAIQVRNDLVEKYAADGKFIEAENHLLRLARNGDAHVAARGLERLARLLLKRKLNADAAYYYELLARNYPDVIIDQKKVSDLVAAVRAAGVTNSATKGTGSSWGDYDLKVVRSGAGYPYGPMPQMKYDGSRLPFFRNHKFDLLPQNRLAMFNAGSDAIDWLIPMRSGSRSSQGNVVVARTSGHQVIAMHRDVLHALSPVEKRLLWTKQIDERARLAGYYRTPSRPATQQMRGVFSHSLTLPSQAMAFGMLAAANDNYISVYGRRQISVIDTMTGDVRWTLENVPTGTTTFGTDDVLYVLPSNRTQNTAGKSGEPFALRAVDGKRIDVPNIQALISHAVRVVGNSFVLFENGPSTSLLGLGQGSLVIRRYNPITKKEYWRTTLKPKSRVTLLDDGYLVTLDSTGRLSLVDLNDGTSKNLGDENDGRNTKLSSEVFALSDHDSIYLFVSNSRNPNYYSPGLPSLRINGPVFAFDRKSGKRLWKEEVSNQYFVYQNFDRMPALVFATRGYVKSGRLRFPNLKLSVLDKKTGRRLVETTVPFNSSFRSLNVNMAERYIELPSYNGRLRLIAVDRKTASAAK